MNEMKLVTQCFLCTLLAFVLVPCAYADWNSDPQHSGIHFVSVKKGSIAEVHHFDTFAVTVDDSKLNVQIQLDSVQTAVEIRDERMREFLFETVKFPAATLTADVSAVDINKLVIGEPGSVEVPAQLSLHGAEHDISLSLNIVRLAEDAILVSSAKPVIINAADFALTEGVVKLADLVGGIDIATAVPVSFSVLMRLSP